MKYLPFIFILVFTSFLCAQTAAAPEFGSGTPTNPYQISSLQNLYWIAADNNEVPEPTQEERWAANYIQTANIDAAETEDWFNGQGWKPIGADTSNPFTGKYNGGNFVISNIYCNSSSSEIGLFGTTYEAEITNINLESGNITGSSNTALLIGRADYTTIINCRVSGTVNGADWVGGVVGLSHSSQIQNCVNNADITGFFYIGGIVGNISNNTIENCFNRGSISGFFNIGGLVGEVFESSYIDKCYSTGIIVADQADNAGGLVGDVWDSETTIINCYWDTESSGINISAGGEARTTQEMTYPYAENTYVDWEFGEIWLADEDYSNNDGYPYLNPTSMGDIISYTETTGTIPLEVEFSINEPAEGYVYNWDADGDGNYDGSGTVFSFTYNQVGTFSVVLQICQPNLPPATITYPDLVEVTLPFEIERDPENFSQFHFFVNEPNIEYTYKWDVDNDGQIDGVGADFYYIYDELGIYTVVLEIYDGEEYLGSVEQELNTIQFNSQWVTIEPCEGLMPLAIDINHTYNDPYFVDYKLKLFNTHYQNYELETYLWGASYLINKPGIYNGEFWGAEEWGMGWLDWQILETFDNCLRVKGASFSATDYVINTGETIYVNAFYEFDDIQEYSWDFNNDGEIDSNTANPHYTYTQPGDYQISVTLDTEEGELTYTDDQTVHVTGEFLDLHQQYFITFTDESISNSQKEVSLVDYNNDGKDDLYIAVKKPGYIFITIMEKEGNILYQEELPSSGDEYLFVTEHNGTHYRAHYDEQTLTLTNLDNNEEFTFDYTNPELYDFGLLSYSNSLYVAFCNEWEITYYEFLEGDFIDSGYEYVSYEWSDPGHSGSWGSVSCLDAHFYQNSIVILKRHHNGSDIQPYDDFRFQVIDSELEFINGESELYSPVFTFCNSTNSYKVCGEQFVQAYSNYYYEDEEMLLKFTMNDFAVTLNDLEGNIVATETLDILPIGMVNIDGQLLVLARNYGNLAVYTDGEEFVSNQPQQIPISNTTLYQNYPNPFNPQTTIEFALKEPGNVELDIYNLKGQKICTLVDKNLAADNHSFIWNGRDENNNPVASGIYFYRLQTAQQVITKKMMLLK